MTHLDRRSRRVRWLLVTVIAGLVILAGLYLAFVRYNEDAQRPPDIDLLSPLPSGIDLVLDRTFRGGGSSEARRRLVVVEGRKLAAEDMTARLRRSLADRGWNFTTQRAALSPDNNVCIGLDDAALYVRDPVRGAEQKGAVMSILDSGSQDRGYVVVSMLRC